METSLFSAHGRMSRGRYWMMWLISTIVMFGFVYFATATRTEKSILLILPVAGFLTIQQIKRMHDVNRSGWYVLVPIYNLVLALTRGDEGSNDYGPDPLGSTAENYTSSSDVIDSPESTWTSTPEDQALNNKQAITYFVIYIVYGYLNSLILHIMFRMSDREFGGKNVYEKFGPFFESFGFILLFVLMATVRNRQARAGFVLILFFQIAYRMITSIPISM